MQHIAITFLSVGLFLGTFVENFSSSANQLSVLD